MKKILLIIILFIPNIFFIYNIDKTVSVEKIDLNLKFNELGVIFLNLEYSNSLIISLNQTNILYIVDYKKYDLEKELKHLNMKIDFIVMNDEYDIPLSVPKKIVKSSLNINNIVFNNGSFKSINYNDNTICINNSNCDFVYYTNNHIKLNENKVLFYNQDIKLTDNIYNNWIDIYKINKSIYTILKINDSYEILEIIKNI